MRKFKLAMEALEVESFTTDSVTVPHGTVLGNETRCWTAGAAWFRSPWRPT